MDNALVAFQFDSNIAHGAFVAIEDGVAALLARRRYAPGVRQLIAEAMAAMPLLATHLHSEARINLQFQSSAPGSPVKLLVAQIDQHLTVRGMAKAAPAADGSFVDLLADGTLALMIEPTDAALLGTQATVPLEGEALAQALETYFAQSEQLPTLLRLAVEGDHLRGFLLQRLPLEHTQAKQEDWEHLAILAATLTTDELLTQSPETLLRRLFAQESLTVFAPRPVAVACRCSESGIGRLLLSLGREEVDSILAEQQRVTVTCEFCGREYVYLPAEAHALFEAAALEPAATRH